MIADADSLKAEAEKLQTPLKVLKQELDEVGKSGRIAFEGLNMSIDVTDMKAGGLKEKIVNMMREINQAIIEANAEGLITDKGVEKTEEKLGLIGESFKNFKDGFMGAIGEQKNAMQQIKDIGAETFGELKKTLTDFVMTGKLKFQDLAKTVVRMFVEMLIGQAVQFAFKKSMALFKFDAISKAMINVFKGASKTFSETPFPLNVALVGGAIAFGMGLVNKIKSFEKGGRPPEIVTGKH